MRSCASPFTLTDATPPKFRHHLTVVTLERTASGTDVTMECEPLHDEEWTGRLVGGRTNELDNLERLVGSTA